VFAEVPHDVRSATECRQQITISSTDGRQQACQWKTTENAEQRSSKNVLQVQHQMFSPLQFSIKTMAEIQLISAVPLCGNTGKQIKSTQLLYKSEKNYFTCWHDKSNVMQITQFSAI